MRPNSLLFLLLPLLSSSFSSYIISPRPPTLLLSGKSDNFLRRNKRKIGFATVTFLATLSKVTPVVASAPVITSEAAPVVQQQAIPSEKKPLFRLPRIRKHATTSSPSVDASSSVPAFMVTTEYGSPFLMYDQSQEGEVRGVAYYFLSVEVRFYD